MGNEYRSGYHRDMGLNPHPIGDGGLGSFGGLNTGLYQQQAKIEKDFLSARQQQINLAQQAMLKNHYNAQRRLRVQQEKSEKKRNQEHKETEIMGLNDDGTPVYGNIILPGDN